MKTWTLTTALLLSYAQIARAEAEPMERAASIFAIPGAYLLLLAILALIVAFAVVGRMKAKLKTAAKQAYASRYIREGSFDLRVQSDRFLYETVQRRKIENKQQSGKAQKG
jgi:hypothetical protein